MVQKVVTYSVKSDALEAAIGVLKEFVEGVRKNEPQTNYHIYQVRDNKVQFIHMAGFADEQAEKKHHQAEYTQKFLADLKDLCETQPIATDIDVVAFTKGDGVVDWANE